MTWTHNDVRRVITDYMEHIDVRRVITDYMDHIDVRLLVTMLKIDFYNFKIKTQMSAAYPTIMSDGHVNLCSIYR